MGLLSVLLACSDPTQAALALCAASPGLYEDEQGRALLSEHMDTGPYADGVPTIGHALAQGREALRGATCTVTSREGERVDLERTQPTVAADGSLGREQRVSLSWTVKDGVVDIGLADALQKRVDTQEAIRAGDLPLFVGTWESLAASFPDPLLAADTARAQRLLDQALYRKHLVPLPDSVQEALLVGHVENRGDHAVSGMRLSADFEGIAKEQILELGPLAAGASLPFELPIPEGALGGYVLTVSACSF